MKLFVVPIAALALLTACDSAEERAEKHYQSGLALLSSGDTERALVEFRNVFALDQNNTEARLVYAKAARSIGNIPESYTNFLRIVERLPDHHEARLALTEMAIETQNWEEATRHGAALIEANVELEGAETAKLALEFREAVLDQDVPRIRELTKRAEELLKSRPDDIILHRLLIEGHSRDGNNDRALEVADNALILQPDDRALYLVKARLLNRAGDPEGVERHLRDTIAKFPDDDQSKALLIRQLSSRGKIDAAEGFLREEIGRSAEPSKAHVTLIAYLRETRGDDAALEEVETAITSYEDNLLFRALKAGITFDSGDRENAISIMETVVDGTEPSEETNRYKVTLAKMLSAVGNDVGARQLVEDVLAANPSQVAALKMSARWQIDSDQPEEALRSLRLALDNDPDDAEAMTLMAEAHERNGSKELAQDVLALAVEASGSAPRESLLLARQLFEQKRYRPAEDVLIRALRRTPRHTGLLTLLGRIYLADEDWPRADQVQRTLAKVGTSQATARANELQLQILGRRDGRQRAVAFLEDLTSSETGDTAATIALIRARISEERNEEALTIARELANRTPDDPRAKLVLGNTQFATGRYQEAEATLRESFEQAKLADTALQLVRVLGAQSRPDDARETLDDAITVVPDNARLLFAKAGILERENDFDGAIAIYERLYENNTGSLVIANNLASMLATYKDDQESLEKATKVARRLRGSTVAPFQDTYGWILFRNGNYDEALTYLEPAAQGLAGDPIVQFHLAKTYQALGRESDAKAAFQRAIDIAPDDDPRNQIAEAREYLERASDN